MKPINASVQNADF